MDPSLKNWFSLFFDECKLRLLEDAEQLEFLFAKYKSTSEFCHYFLHESGLFYGHISYTKFCFHNQDQTWAEVDKFKVALAEGFILMYLHSQKISPKSLTAENLTKTLLDAVQKVHDFYVLFSVNDEYKKYRVLYERSNDAVEIVEQILDLRVDNPSVLKLNFWKGAEFNIFANLDVLYFVLWLQGIYAYDRRVKIKNEIVAILSHIANLDDQKGSNAKAMAMFFSSLVNENSENQTAEKFQCSCQDEHRMIRLVLYDYAIFSCFSDNVLSPQEFHFLQTLSRDLHLDESDTQESVFMIENFLLCEGNNIFYLQYGDGLDVVRRTFANRLQTFVQKNKTKIVAEILESKELVELIRKSVSEKLTDEEREKVRKQIFDVLKTIPSLTIFMIPGGMIILPILLKILPEDVLKPSSFINKKKEI